MSKLKEKLLTEISPTQDERKKANIDIMIFIRNLEDNVKETKQLRKELGPLYGRELKKAEKDLKTIISQLNDVLMLQKAKTGRMVTRK